MTIGYRVAYALHVTPWERAGRAGAGQLHGLVARAEAAHGPHGAALDLGCGTGSHAVDLARRGWAVTGVDTVPRALGVARRRAEEAGMPVRLLHADATELDGVETAGGFRLVLDVGCFHGLTDDQRAATGQAVTRVAAPDATLVLMAMSPGGRGPLPRGACQADVERAFPGWRTTHVEPADTAGMPRALRRSNPRFYVLQRN